MFAIGDTQWPGLGKLMEEMGELMDVLGKIIALSGESVQTWPGGRDLKPELVEELGDVRAALIFFCEANDVPKALVHDRADMKLDKFRHWHQEHLSEHQKQIEQAVSKMNNQQIDLICGALLDAEAGGLRDVKPVRAEAIKLLRRINVYALPESS